MSHDAQSISSELAVLRQLVDSLSEVGLFAVAADGQILSWNCAAQRITGYTRDDVVGRPLDVLWAAENGHTLPWEASELAGAPVETIGRRIRRKDGQIADVAVRIAPLHPQTKTIDWGVQLQLAPTPATASAPPAAEINSGQNERRLRLLLDNTRVVVWEADPTSFDFTFVSDHCEQLLGYPAQQWLEHDFWPTHIHPDDAEQAVACCLESLQQFRDNRFEYRMLHADGGHVWVDDSVKVVAVQGRVTALYGALVDVTERKRAEQAIRDSEVRYRAFVEHAADAMFLHQPQGQIVDLNRQASESLGYTREELITQTPFLFDVDLTVQKLEEFGARLDSGETLAFDSRHRSKNGAIFPVSVRIRPFMVDGQRYAVSLVKDITHRKAVEAQLRASSEQYRLALDAAELGTWKHDLTTDEFWLDARCQAHHGLQHSVVKAAELFAAVHPDDAQRVQTHIASVIDPFSRGEVSPIDFRIMRGDGLTRWLTVRASANFESRGGALHATSVIGTTLDITERKRAETQLMASERRFRELADAIPQIVWTATPDGSLDHLNARVVEYTGVHEQDLTGWSWERVIHPDDLQHTMQAWGEILQSAAPRDVEFRILRADGSYRWHVTRQVAATDAQGNVTRWYGTCTDIEELKRAQQAILWQSRVLEKMAGGDPLPDILERIVELIEAKLPGAIASILMLDRREGRLSWAAGGRLPAAFSQAIDGTRIGPAVGSCGTAAFRGETVVVADIATDPLWRNFRELALTFNLRCCWSVPIFGGGITAIRGAVSEVLGTFAVYKHEPASPEPEALEVLIRAAHLAGIAIERDCASSALRESEERHRNLVELAPDGFAIIQNGCISYANHAATQLFGADSPGSLIGKQLTDFMHPGERSEGRRRQELVLRSEESVPLRQFRIRRLDGVWRVMEFCAGPCRHHGQPAIQLIARDVSERTHTENALRESEERFRQIATAIDHVFWMVSYPEVRSLYVSPAFATIWGSTPEEFYANPKVWMEAIVPQDRQRVQERHQFWLSDPVNQIFEAEYRVMRPDGEIRWIFDRGTAIRDNDGNIYRLTGVAQDITEKKRLETQFHQAQKMEAVGQLAGGIAHDFNNLLMVVSGFSELLLEDATLLAAQREAIGAIREAGVRAASLTRQLLAFSRKQILEPVILDVNELVRQAEPMIRRLIREDVVVTVRLADDLLRIKADPAQIDQVLLNLVLNARDAMPTGGRLLMETVNWQEPAGEYYVCLRVSDTGLGMDEEAKSKIFEPFFTTKPIGQGTGLGMAVVHGIVNQSGGQIRVDSQLGRGTTVELLLPVTGLPLTAQPVSTRSSIGPRGAETILLAEDEPAVRRIVRNCLEMQGYTVLEADHGAHALEIAGNHDGAIDLLLTDVIMPVMGGLQLAEILASHRPGLKTLFMSGYTDSEALQLGVEVASLRILQKPFDPDSLVKKVRTVLDQSADLAS